MKLTSITILALTALASVASADYSTWTQSIVGVGNTASPGTGVSPLAFDSSTGSGSSATASKSFTGMNGTGVMQTMDFTGTSTESAQFGRLRSHTSGSLTNSYYNSANPVYVKADGSIDPSGSPDSLVSLGFAGFNDTLHFGGTLQAGYTARYIFRVDGTNTGQGYLADMVVKIADDPDEVFFAFSPGYNATTWATTSHEINGISPQTIRVQFSTQTVFDTFNLTDGGDYTGDCDFSATLVLAGIEVRDGSGNLATDVTVTSDSGTAYPVPEPASLLTLGILVPAFLRRRKRTA